MAVPTLQDDRAILRQQAIKVSALPPKNKLDQKIVAYRRRREKMRGRRHQDDAVEKCGWIIIGSDKASNAKKRALGLVDADLAAFARQRGDKIIAPCWQFSGWIEAQL
jgi:hypothetical protein